MSGNLKRKNLLKRRRDFFFWILTQLLKLKEENDHGLKL